MTTAQRVIKYLAIALAIFIILNIISMIVFGIYIFADILGLRDGNKIEQISSNKNITTSFEDSDIQALKIDMYATNLTIKQGSSFKIETTNKNVEYKQNRNQLEIIEKKHNWFSQNVQENLIIYIPTGVTFEKVDIETGAGQIEIDKLYTEKLSLEVGAGKVKIQELKTIETADIDGGAGKVEILNGTMKNLDLDMGVGECSITTKLTGNNKINAGIGKLEINLTDSKENYKIRVNKGIGSIKINGKEMTNDEIYGSGNNFIRIDGGIGTIDVKNIGEF